MAPLLDIAGHPLLSGKYNAAGEGEQDAQQQLAELLLGVDEAYVSRLSTVQTENVKTAVVLQTNFMLEQGIDPFIIESSTSSIEAASRKYRDVVIHPQAEMIMEGIVLSDGTGGSTPTRADWAAADVVRSVRGPNS
jgi:hypothetical protein